MATWSDDETMKLIELWGKTPYNDSLSVALEIRLLGGEQAIVEEQRRET